MSPEPPTASEPGPVVDVETEPVLESVPVSAEPDAALVAAMPQPLATASGPPAEPAPAGLTLEQRLRFAEVEIELVQSRFDKFDQLFLGNKKFTVAIAAAALAASAALDQRLALVGASGVALVMFGLEWFHRRTLFAKLVQRHLLLRAALNEPGEIMKLVVYDPFNDMDRPQHPAWRAQKSWWLNCEMYIFYGVLCVLPLLLAWFMPAAHKGP